MSEDIYSDLWAEVLISEGGTKRVHIHQQGTIYTKPLILPNLLAVKRLRDYLDKICKKNKKYFINVGEPLEKKKIKKLKKRK